MPPVTNVPESQPIPKDAPLEEQVAALIETLSNYIEYYHGGVVKLVDFDGKWVKVRLGGACEGCPLTETTLRGWIEGTLKQFFPQIEGVENVGDATKTTSTG